MARETQRETQLDKSPLHLLHRVRQCAGELFQAEMVGIDLTARQYVILVAAAQRDGQSQQEIIDSTGIDRSTVSQVVQTMARKGLLKRRRTRGYARLCRHLDAARPRRSQGLRAHCWPHRRGARRGSLRDAGGRVPRCPAHDRRIDAPRGCDAMDADGDAPQIAK
jgi:biotin operon repressor